jgi:hypothetical protein
MDKVEEKEKISIILLRVKTQVKDAIKEIRILTCKAVSILFLNTKIQHSNYFEC